MKPRHFVQLTIALRSGAGLGAFITWRRIARDILVGAYSGIFCALWIFCLLAVGIPEQDARPILAPAR